MPESWPDRADFNGRVKHERKADFLGAREELWGLEWKRFPLFLVRAAAFIPIVIFMYEKRAKGRTARRRRDEGRMRDSRKTTRFGRLS
jgi:hypothetical protein